VKEFIRFHVPGQVFEDEVKLSVNKNFVEGLPAYSPAFG
jgi:hypothetical protein